MKRSIVLLGVAVFALLIIFQSCKKDHLPEMDSIVYAPKPNMESYDEFGPGLEKAISMAVLDEEFKSALIKLTQERRMGDYEILMTSLLKFKSKGGISIKDILLENAVGIFTESELDAFLDQFPSLIIATRGSVVSWFKNEHIPPTVFVPSDFRETETRIEGTKKGERVEVKIDQRFQDAVIAMHLSERHDRSGNPLNPEKSTFTPPQQPSIDLSDETTASLRSCWAERTFCDDPFLIEDFEVSIEDGGIKITYDIPAFEHPELNGCSIALAEATITREGGTNENGEIIVVEIVRSGGAPTSFFDVNVTPNTNYTYTISAMYRFNDPNTGEMVFCTSDNTLSGSAEAPDALPFLTSFRGENQSSTELKYNWYVPNNDDDDDENDIAVQNYRLRVYENGAYNTVATLPGDPSNLYYTYTHPASMQGSKVEMQIQYRENGPYSGDYFDRSYASFRDPGQPLYFYGMKLSSEAAQQLEINSTGENPLHGAPEIRLIAVKGDGDWDDRYAVPVQQAVRFMKSCSITEWVWGHQISFPSDKWIPISGVPVTILPNWVFELRGSAITTFITETDAPEITILEVVEEQSNEFGISGEFGYKSAILPGGTNAKKPTTEVVGGPSATIGVEASWTSTKETKFDYPDGEIPMDLFTIYYHDPFLMHTDRSLYGYSPLHENSSWENPYEGWFFNDPLCGFVENNMP